jgi:hypothetical protein
MEVWKDVIGYEGLYQASSFGKIKSLSKLKTIKNKYRIISYTTKEIILKAGSCQGYERVVLIKDGLRSTKKVHRIIASAFLGDEPNKCVNHIDFNRSNNNINNLEWLTSLENNRHSRINNRYPKLIMSDNHKQILSKINSKKVVCTKTNKIYNSATEASLELGYKRSTLIHYLVGTRTNKSTLKYL